MITKIHQEKHIKKSPKRTCLRHRGSCKPKNYTCNVQPFNVYPSASSVGEQVIYIYILYICAVCILNISTKAIRFHRQKPSKTQKKPPLILKLGIGYNLTSLIFPLLFFGAPFGGTPRYQNQGFGAGQWQDCGHSNRGFFTVGKNSLKLIPDLGNQDKPNKNVLYIIHMIYIYIYIWIIYTDYMWIIYIGIVYGLYRDYATHLAMIILPSFFGDSIGIV